MMSRLNPYICLSLRIYIGSVFIYASLYKIVDPNSFALTVASYQILPHAMVNIFALILPWIEIVTGFMIVAGFRVKASSFLILLMMMLFLTALIIALSKGIDMACGCFASSELEDAISMKTIFRDLFWIMIGLYIFITDKFPLGIDKLTKRQ